MGKLSDAARFFSTLFAVQQVTKHPPVNAAVGPTHPQYNLGYDATSDVASFSAEAKSTADCTFLSGKSDDFCAPFPSNADGVPYHGNCLAEFSQAQSNCYQATGAVSNTFNFDLEFTGPNAKPIEDDVSSELEPAFDLFYDEETDAGYFEGNATSQADCEYFLKQSDDFCEPFPLYEDGDSYHGDCLTLFGSVQTKCLAALSSQKSPFDFYVEFVGPNHSSEQTESKTESTAAIPSTVASATGIANNAVSTAAVANTNFSSAITTSLAAPSGATDACLDVLDKVGDAMSPCYSDACSWEDEFENCTEAEATRFTVCVCSDATIAIALLTISAENEDCPPADLEKTVLSAGASNLVAIITDLNCTIPTTGNTSTTTATASSVASTTAPAATPTSTGIADCASIVGLFYNAVSPCISASCNITNQFATCVDSSATVFATCLCHSNVAQTFQTSLSNLPANCSSDEIQAAFLASLPPQLLNITEPLNCTAAQPSKPSSGNESKLNDAKYGKKNTKNSKNSGKNTEAATQPAFELTFDRTDDIAYLNGSASTNDDCVYLGQQQQSVCSYFTDGDNEDDWYHQDCVDEFASLQKDCAAGVASGNIPFTFYFEFEGPGPDNCDVVTGQIENLLIPCVESIVGCNPSSSADCTSSLGLLNNTQISAVFACACQTQGVTALLAAANCSDSVSTVGLLLDTCSSKVAEKNEAKEEDVSDLEFTLEYDEQGDIGTFEGEANAQDDCDYFLKQKEDFCEWFDDSEDGDFNTKCHAQFDSVQLNCTQAVSKDDLPFEYRIIFEGPN